LKHKYVCEYKHFFEDRQNCYILLELCHNQSMNEMIKRRKRLTEPEAAFFMRQLLEAIQYLHHDQLVIHRDLKLGNLFLDKEMNIKVGDLGLATRLESLDEKRTTICGTPNYIAPEVIQGDRATRGHSFEVDVWSMGVILYTWLVGKPPYEAKDVKATYQRIINNEYTFPSKVDISDNAKALITSMLRSKPADRPSLDMIALHPFFTESFIPTSLHANTTHTAPKWDKADLKAGSGLRKPNLPLSSNRRPFSYRDVNVEPSGSDRSKTTKLQKTSVDVQGVVKNVVSAVMSVGNKASDNQGFKVFDESKGTGEEDIISRTAAMSIRTQNVTTNPFPTSDAMPSPTSDDAFVLHNMIDRIDNVLETTSKRSYANINTDSISLREFSTGGPDKWVARYVDYTSKYGMGFLLSDGRYV
jgi:serine/threonine protein kinase